MPVIIGPPPIPIDPKNALGGSIKPGPPIGPPGGNPNVPDYIDIVNDTVTDLNRRLKKYTTDERNRIMHQINARVEGANTVQGTKPS